MSTATIRLPSLGKFNPELGGEHVVIRNMKTPEEKILYSNRPSAEKIVHIVQKCVEEPKGFSAHDLPLTDVMLLFFEIRHLSLPSHRTYSYPVTCEDCNRGRWTEQLEIPKDLQIVYASDDATEPFECTIPKGDTLGIKHLRAKDNIEIDKHVSKAMQLSKVKADPEEIAFPYRMAKQIVSINGEVPRGSIYEVQAYFEQLDYEDSLAIHHSLDENDFGAKLTREAECPVCGNWSEHIIKLKADFFRPRRLKSRGI